MFSRMPLSLMAFTTRWTCGWGSSVCNVKAYLCFSAKFLPREVPRRLKPPLRRGAGWHGKHDLVDQLRRAPGDRGQVRLSAILFQVEVPVFEQALAGILPLDALAVVGFEVELTVAANIVEVASDRAKAVAVP